MSRSRLLIIYALTALTLCALFVVFIGFRGDTELVGALEAAGTVAAAGFAALAAVGSMRAAAESSATAKRSREALARTMQPRVLPSVSRENGVTIGRVRCGTDRAAVEVTVVWSLTGRGVITERTARLDPAHQDLPPGTDTAVAVDLKLPESANVWTEINMVWIEYWDDNHVGHWRDTWQVSAEPGSQPALVRTDSQLVD